MYKKHLSKEEQIAYLESEIEKLATYIMGHVPGEPSQSEGACDTAIRLLKKYYGE